jgi:hypothetical protein
MVVWQIKNPPCQPGTGFLALAVFVFASGTNRRRPQAERQIGADGNYLPAAVLSTPAALAMTPAGALFGAPATPAYNRSTNVREWLR